MLTLIHSRGLTFIEGRLYFEWPNHVWRASKTSILNTESGPLGPRWPGSHHLQGKNLADRWRGSVNGIAKDHVMIWSHESWRTTISSASFVFKLAQASMSAILSSEFICQSPYDCLLLLLFFFYGCRGDFTRLGLACRRLEGWSQLTSKLFLAICHFAPPFGFSAWLNVHKESRCNFEKDFGWLQGWVTGCRG